MNNLFPLLAIETSGELCSTTLFLDNKKYSEFNIRFKHVHSEKLLIMVKEVMSSLAVAPSELKSVAVSEGPGSFTGLRIGMAAAKGIAMGSGIPIIPVPTFDALAYNISGCLPKGTEFYIINNVNVEEVYFAGYKKMGDTYKTIERLQLKYKDDLNPEGKLIFGNYADKLLHFSDSPTGYDIGAWAYKFGEDLLTSEYDFLEPKYLKDFVARIKK